MAFTGLTTRESVGMATVAQYIAEQLRQAFTAPVLLSESQRSFRSRAVEELLRGY